MTVALPFDSNLVLNIHNCRKMNCFVSYVCAVHVDFETDYVCQSHTGKALADAFQAMLVRFRIQDKILSFNADNASNNDTQTTELALLNNSFDAENRGHCMGHILSLAAKDFLLPFNSGLSGQAPALQPVPTNFVTPAVDEDDEVAGFLDDDEEVVFSEETDIGESAASTLNDEIAQLVADTAAVRATVTKVSVVYILAFI